MSKEKLFDTSTKPKFDKKNALSAAISKSIDTISDPVIRENIIINIVNKEFIISLIKIVIGAIGFFIGICWLYKGITGQINLEISSEFISAKIINGSPGLALIIISIIFMSVTGINIKK
ncbi:MAG: hypothetical protein LBO65_09575 [Spirochaetaceae bacterium]|jgi:hypothetical protein|nr:hypothetical protein [Spirochaetaceae bacterium]